MKKPLQGKQEPFLVSSKGRLIAWGVADVKNLIKNANKAKTENLVLENGLTLHEAECFFAREWFDTFIDKGFTKEVIDKLNARIAHVWYHHILMPSPKGLPYWRHVANADRINEPELSISYSVAQLLAYGALEGLKRCGQKDCEKYFIGRPNVKWCSKSCGSLFRVRQKRKKERS